MKEELNTYDHAMMLSNEESYEDMILMAVYSKMYKTKSLKKALEFYPEADADDFKNRIAVVMGYTSEEDRKSFMNRIQEYIDI